ncbi:HisA/HisF-related TIM barrel protein, partial [Vreelandella neptunia]|uniref:HisA/HisF-related TIM barrel protein n=1 Tax=Vreelandella neptunia TaxID=115551 RepID=UPI0025B39E0F
MVLKVDEDGAVALAAAPSPIIDAKDGRVVKGVNFVNLRDAGDPVEQAAVYDAAGADDQQRVMVGQRAALLQRRIGGQSRAGIGGGECRIEVADIEQILLVRHQHMA